MMLEPSLHHPKGGITKWKIFSHLKAALLFQVIIPHSIFIQISNLDLYSVTNMKMGDNLTTRSYQLVKLVGTYSAQYKKNWTYCCHKFICNSESRFAITMGTRLICMFWVSTTTCPMNSYAPIYNLITHKFSLGGIHCSNRSAIVLGKRRKRLFNVV